MLASSDSDLAREEQSSLHSSINGQMPDPLDQRLIAALERFVEAVGFYGVQVRAYSEKSIQKLAEVSPEKKDEIARYYEAWRTWIDPVDVGVTDLNEGAERVFLARALKHFGFEVDESFWATLERDQLIEVYSDNMVQIYRSISFLKLTGYSLLDLSLFEWYLLYERPKVTVQRMMEAVGATLSKNVSCAPVHVGRHILREVFDNGFVEPFEPRAAAMEFVNIGAIRPMAPTPQMRPPDINGKTNPRSQAIEAEGAAIDGKFATSLLESSAEWTEGGETISSLRKPVEEVAADLPAAAAADLKWGTSGSGGGSEFSDGAVQPKPVMPACGIVVSSRAELLSTKSRELNIEFL